MTDVIGNGEIQVNGKTYRIKPSFKALITIEKNANSSIVQIIQRFAQYDSRVQDVTAILYGCIVGANPSFVDMYSFEEFGDIVYEHVSKHGLMDISTESFSLVSDVLLGSQDKKKSENTSQ